MALHFARVLVGLVLVLGLFAGVSTPRVARGDNALSESERKARKTKLRRRASEWWRTRKRLIAVCHQCKGGGRVYYRRRGWVTCPKCDGNKYYLEDDRYKKLYYDMRSPSFRQQEGIQEKLNRQFLAARSGPTRPAVIEAYDIEKVEVLDARYGLAYVEENREGVAQPQRWVWGTDERGRCDWYLWDEAADGRWSPGAASGEAASGGFDAPPLAASAELRTQVLAALSNVPLGFEPREILVDEGVLVLRLIPPVGTRPELSEQQVGAAAVDLVRALFPAIPAHPAIRAEWFGCWRNKLGRTDVRARWTTTLTRHMFDQIVWKNLLEKEQIDTLDWNPHAYEGWIPWTMTEAPQSRPLAAPDIDEPEPPGEEATAAWVDYLGHSFPPRKAYGHGVEVPASCDESLDPDGSLCTGRFTVEVYQQPEPIRSRSADAAPATAELAFVAPAPEPGEPLPAWVRVRIFVRHGAGLDVEKSVQRRVEVWADGVHVGGGGPIDTKRVGGGRDHVVLTARWSAVLPVALKIARASDVIMRFGTVGGITVSLGPDELSVLQDLLSRLVR